MDIQDLLFTPEDAADQAFSPDLQGLDIGSLELPGSVRKTGERIKVAGGGRMQNGSKDDLFFAGHPFAGMKRIETRLDSVSNPNSGKVIDTDTAGLPDTAQHVDVEARLRQEKMDELVSGPDTGARAGLMIRSSEEPDAAFTAIAPRPTGELLPVWRVED